MDASWKQVLQLHGNTQTVFCVATIVWANFIRWRLPIIINKPIPALRWFISVKIRAQPLSLKVFQRVKVPAAYRGLVRMNPGAEGARNYTQCDSLLIGDKCGAHTFPYIESKETQRQLLSTKRQHQKVSDDQLFLCKQRGLDAEKQYPWLNGFCREIFKKLPMEFAVEAGKLLEVSLEGST